MKKISARLGSLKNRLAHTLLSSQVRTHIAIAAALGGMASESHAQASINTMATNTGLAVQAVRLAVPGLALIAGFFLMWKGAKTMAKKNDRDDVEFGDYARPMFAGAMLAGLSALILMFVVFAGGGAGDIGKAL